MNQTNPIEPISDPNLTQLVHAFAQLPEVDAILLAGSHGIQQQDEHSDYDLYVYVNQEISVETRRKLTAPYTEMMELNNQFWETEDDGELKDSHKGIEIIYRSLDWIEEMLQQVAEKHVGGIGYSTCFWSNYMNSHILYDASGRAKQLQERFRVPYPAALKLDILKKNYPLLRSQLPAYAHQIHKAILRKDGISVNHRVAAFLASYFDILFAINELLHPGEKKLLPFAYAKCQKLPQAMDIHIEKLLQSAGEVNMQTLEEVHALVDSLDELLKKEELYQYKV